MNASEKWKSRIGLWRRRRPGESLGEYLFGLVERSQGHAFISDGISEVGYPDQRIVNLARGSLHHTLEVVSQLKAFIAKYERASEGAREELLAVADSREEPQQQKESHA